MAIDMSQLPAEAIQRYQEVTTRENQVQEAIRAGIGESGRDLTITEQRAVEAHVDLSLDLFTVPGTALTEREEKLVREFARHTAQDPLLTKALVAIFLEQGLTDRPILDGPVGRALDEAISVLTPLASRVSAYWTEA